MEYHRGYTLLELLIALTVVSILAVIAVPIYLNYELRAKITEGFSVAEPVKVMVTDYYQTMGNWPDSNSTAGVGDPTSFRTEYVDAITVAKSGPGAAITITYRMTALGSNNTIILTSSANAGHAVLWQCTGGSLIEKYRPAACKS